MNDIFKLFQLRKWALNNLKQKINARVKAFSLLEVAIALMIIGVLTMAVMKGQSLLKSARLDKTAHQIEAIKLNIEMATSNSIEVNEIDDLIKEQLMNKKETIPAIGGKFFIKNDENSQIYILLASNEETPFLNKKDAQTLKFKIDGELEEGSVSLINNGDKYALKINI
jgi:prepilin-type N-terminal cleavage/methylation domain-containing protein